MSTMQHPESVPERVMREIEACSECESDRRPRMFVCAYHEGWWDGWEARTPEDTIPESVFHSAHDEAVEALEPWEVFVADDGMNAIRAKTGDELDVRTCVSWGSVIRR